MGGGVRKEARVGGRAGGGGVRSSPVNLGDGLAEGLALLGVVARLIEGALSKAHSASGNLLRDRERQMV